ncbi:MAG: hypothetical protein IJ240_02410 [Clostridia bacterium]|nr:hypothetical protein [Clostridia bacterium]
MYQYAAQNRNNYHRFSRLTRVLSILSIVFLATTILFGVLYWQASAANNKTREQLRQSMTNNAANALNATNRLDSVTISNTSQRLGLIRQYIYAMEQINKMSISLYGEGGRFVPDDAFTALYADLENYDTIALGAKSSTVEVRELLISHLNLVQGYITGALVS